MKAVDLTGEQREGASETLGSDRNELGEVSWRAFQIRLRGYVGKRVPECDIDDVVGDILLKLVRSREALEIASSPYAWILRVAANTVTDYYRHRSSQRGRQASAEVEYFLSPEGEDESSGASAREISACLAPFIRNLPAAYAETLMLTDLGGLKQSEAARQLGVSLSAVKSRAQRGRAKLKQALLRCCELELDRFGSVISYRPRGGCCARS